MSRSPPTAAPSPRRAQREAAQHLGHAGGQVLLASGLQPDSTPAHCRRCRRACARGEPPAQEFEQMQDMMKKMKGGGLMKMMKRMGGMKAWAACPRCRLVALDLLLNQ